MGKISFGFKWMKFLIIGIIFLYLWTGGMLINFFGWKNLGSNALPLYPRILIFVLIIVIYYLLLYFTHRKTSIQRKITSLYLQSVLILIMVLTYIWQDIFYNQLDGNAYMIFHPGLLISVVLYFSIMIANLKLIYTWVNK